MNARVPHLNVFLNDHRVGALFDTEPLSFEYSEEWLQDGRAIPLGAIPGRGGRIEDPAVLAFFDNLLPEGDIRAYLGTCIPATTIATQKTSPSTGRRPAPR